MNPREFERLVAAHFSASGFEVTLTSITNDAGVDIFAAKNGRRTAIQVKMYGQTRQINRAAVFELFGAARFADCSDAVIATDGDLLPTAQVAADKLGIKIIKFQISEPAEDGQTPNSNIDKFHHGTSDEKATFEERWANFVIPLIGTSVETTSGASSIIISADWTGITRLTSTGRTRTIPIEIFRQTFLKLEKDGVVARDWINQEFVGRASSGVVAILASFPDVCAMSGPSRLVKA